MSSYKLSLSLDRKPLRDSARDAGRELRDGGRISIGAANLGLRGDVVAEHDHVVLEVLKGRDQDAPFLVLEADTRSLVQAIEIAHRCEHGAHGSDLRAGEVQK
ncbi:hypothetical protein KCU61_g232, partial [Aureobasidium melanogenum]